MTVHQLNDVLRPHEVSLMNAINKAIDEIAVGNMTLIEILGCLDCVSKDIHFNHSAEED